MYSELPLVTIVTPCLNMESYIAKTIESVLGQDYPNIEYILVDGCQVFEQGVLGQVGILELIDEKMCETLCEVLPNFRIRTQQRRRLKKQVCKIQATSCLTVAFVDFDRTLQGCQNKPMPVLQPLAI